MKKLCLLMLLVAAQVSAAEWKKMGDLLQAGVYINDAMVRPKGDSRRVWILYDFNKPPDNDDGKGHRSSVNLLEISCGDRVAILKSINRYAGNMASGNLLASTYSLDFPQQIIRGSLMDRIRAEVCK